MNPESILHDVVSWGEKYPYAFPRWFGPFLPTLVIHHPEYAKNILGRSGSLYLWFRKVFDTFLPKKYWETCLELSPLPASFTTIAILFFVPLHKIPGGPRFHGTVCIPGQNRDQVPVPSSFLSVPSLKVICLIVFCLLWIPPPQYFPVNQIKSVSCHGNGSQKASEVFSSAPFRGAYEWNVHGSPQ